MTKIQSITAHVWDQDLALHPTRPVVVITGPNEAGKTSRLRLPELATQKSGRSFPLVGERPAPFYVSAGFETIDGPLLVTREVDHRGKHTLTLNGRNGAIAKNQAYIDRVLGEASSWSVSQLMGMTPEKRLAWLEDRVLQADDTDIADRLVAHAAKLDHVLGGHQMPETCTKAVLVDLLQQVDGARRAADADARRLLQVVNHDREQAQSESLPPHSVDHYRAQIAKIDADIAALAEEIGRADGAQRTRDALKRQIEMATKAASDVPDETVDEIQARWTAGIDKLAEELRQREQAASLAATADEEATVAASEARLAVKSADEKVDDAAGAALAAKDAAATFAGGSCPTCGSAVDESTIEAQLDAVGDANSAYEKLRKVRKGLRVKADTAAAAKATAGAALKAARVAVDDVKDHLARAKRDRDQALSDFARRVDAAGKASKDLEQYQAQLAALPTDVTVEAQREQLEALKADRKVAVVAADVLNDHAVVLAQREEHRMALSDAQGRREAANELIAALGPRGLLGELLADAFGPLVEQVSDFLEPITGSRIWVETDGGFRWGYERGGVRVPIETASESHQAAAYTALGVVVRASLGGWRFVAIDGLEVMEHQRRIAFVAALITACNTNVLDDAWVAWVEDGCGVPEDAHHVVLTGGASCS